MKLDKYGEVNAKYADAIAKYQGAWVPEIVMGGDSGNGVNGAQALINFLMAKTARDLSLDMSVPKGR